MFPGREFDDEKSFEGGRSISPPYLPTSPSNNFLSPVQRPPPRVQSFTSLVGEDYVTSGRTPENYVLGSYSDDDHTTPPSIQSGLQTLSPPPLQPALDPFVTTASAAWTHSYSNSNQKVKKGRPPRAPLAFSASNSNKALPKPSHIRGNSAGEFSFLSALTDPFNDDVVKNRPRGLSWDANSFDLSPTNDRQAVPLPEEDDGFDNPPASILQPLLNDEPPRSILTSPSVKKSPHQKIVESKLSIADIVNPIESEAETAIMKALEARERKFSVGPTSSTIMPHLSNEAVATVQDFSVKQDEQRVESSLTHQHQTKGRSEQLTRPFGARRDAVYRPPSTTADGNNNSMEVMLYNLATIMRSLHVAAEDPLLLTISKDAMPSDNIGHPLAVHPVKRPRTSSDSLANNAALLFRRQVNLPRPISVITSSTIANSKKNDDAVDGKNSNKCDDVELGMSRAHTVYGSSINKSYSVNGLCCCAPMENWETFDYVLRRRKQTLFSLFALLLIYLVLPSVVVAALLFYGLSNPSLPFGLKDSSESYPSISWFIIFLGVRQAMTFTLAKITEMFVIDFLTLKTRFIFRLFGKFGSLVIVQSKGWPSVLFFWALYDLGMLSGNGKFANHWLFYQNAVGLFNASNPSGGITSNVWNYRILIAALLLGLISGLKRVAAGFYLGGRQYATYGSKLAMRIREMIMISQIARLARQMQRERMAQSGDDLITCAHRDNFEIGSSLSSTMSIDKYTRSVKVSERTKLADAMGEWEEPPEEPEIDFMSINGILQFKQALAFMDLSYPFTSSFGLADSRDTCLRSAKEIFKLLLIERPDSDNLQFETLLTIVRDADSHCIDDERIMTLVRIFRPERDGTIDLVGFIRSIDRVYKDNRLLRASIRNSSQIDEAFEAMVAVVFWFIILCFILACWGIDSFFIFLSMATIIILFAFTISTAVSRYIEGAMFIFIRKPYDIGDRISINSIDDGPVQTGENTWYVEKVNLYYTTVRLGATNEVATIANSSLASARIVNAARSPKAMVHVKLKFGLGVKYSKIQLLQESVESFVKSRPREWLKCTSMRCCDVERELGYIQYSITLHHRESWQSIGTILESKAAVLSFCLEVEKKLGMTYLAPPNAVDQT